MRMCGLSYAQIGGKAANAVLPLLKTAETLQVQDFLHSERRKTCRCSFTAARNGGKAAGAGFLHSERRKTWGAALPLLETAVKLQV
ncbi:hypothetical protein AAC387_Pa07g3463 [Persea americana]